METAVPAPSPVGRLKSLYNAVAGWLDCGAPLYALAIRLYLAKVFFTSGWLKATRWDSTLALFANEYHVPVLPPVFAAALGTSAELGLPVLIALGLGTRAAALALFAFNIVAVVSYPDLSDAGLKDHILWGTLTLVLAAYGAGRFAIDRPLGLR